MSIFTNIKRKKLNSKISKLESELGINPSLNTTSEIKFDKWEPHCIATDAGAISITVSKGFSGLRPVYYVNPPNSVEFFFGITFEDKIHKTLLKAQERCDKLNTSKKHAEYSLSKLDI